MQSNLLKTGLHKLLSLRVILSVLLFIDGVMILSPVLFSYTGILHGRTAVSPRGYSRSGL